MAGEQNEVLARLKAMLQGAGPAPELKQITQPDTPQDFGQATSIGPAPRPQSAGLDLMRTVLSLFGMETPAPAPDTDRELSVAERANLPYAGLSGMRPSADDRIGQVGSPGFPREVIRGEMPSSIAGPAKAESSVLSTMKKMVPGAGAKPMPKSAAQMMVDATMGEGRGFSINPTTGELPTDGFMVGYHSNQSGQVMMVDAQDFSVKTIEKFRKAHAQELAEPDTYIGSWREPGTEKVYLEISKKHPDARSATVSAYNQKQPAGLAREADGSWPKSQNAIFDVTGEFAKSLGLDSPFIPVGNVAEYLRSPDFAGKLDEMLQVGLQHMNGKDWWNLYGGPLEQIYGKERVRPLAGFLASTSPRNEPELNLRQATEYLRRLIKGEPIVQPDFRVPADAVKLTPGTQIGLETGRTNNLTKVAAGQNELLTRDKVNDMNSALLGDQDISVLDRRFAKLVDDPAKGIYADAQENSLPGSMLTPDEATVARRQLEKGKPQDRLSVYPTLENVLRDQAKKVNMSLQKYSSYVWEGIGETIKKTNQLFGIKHPGHAIPESSMGFNNIIMQMVDEKAKHLGIPVDEMVKRLRNGDAELLSAVISTGAGAAAFKQWQSRESKMQQSVRDARK